MATITSTSDNNDNIVMLNTMKRKQKLKKKIVL